MAEGASIVPTLVIHAVILAGGKSSRMGQDKALLPFSKNGLTWLENAIKILEGVGFFRSILVSGFEREKIKLDYIKDSSPARGPLAGIHSIFQRMKYRLDSQEFVLFIPVDMPFLSATAITEFVKSSEVFLKKSQCVYLNESFFPILFPLNLEVFKAIENQVFTRQLALKALVTNIPSKSISLSLPSCDLEKNTFENINTTLDWQQMQVE